MNIKTKEATYSQEWTETALDELAETLTASLWAGKGIISEQRVRDILNKAINAALAAERDKGKLGDWLREREQLREQLDMAVEALRICHKAFVILNDPQHASLIDAALAKIGG